MLYDISELSYTLVYQTLHALRPSFENLAFLVFKFETRKLGCCEVVKYLACAQT